MVGHLRAGLGTEVLDDHFLDMAMARMAVADRLQRLDPLGACFADSDQQAGRERHPRPARRFDHLQPPRRQLVRRTIMWTALLRQRSEEHTSELQSLMRISYA